MLDSAPSDVAASAAAGKIHWPVGDTNTIFTRFRNEHGENNVIGLFSGRYYRERDYDQTGVDGVASSASRKLASVLSLLEERIKYLIRKREKR